VGWGQTQAWIPALFASILRIPQMIWVCRATVEWYIDGKTEELWEKPVPVPLYASQIPHGLTRAQTQTFAVRGRWLTTWAMARPKFCQSRILSHWPWPLGRMQTFFLQVLSLVACPLVFGSVGARYPASLYNSAGLRTPYAYCAMNALHHIQLL
jgi:hypothetical protein